MCQYASRLSMLMENVSRLTLGINLLMESLKKYNIIMVNIEIMKNIELTEEQVREAFKKAKSDEAKETLSALFPDIAKELTKKKPTLDDYTSITSYEDACEALDYDPVDFDMLWPDLPKHIVALMMLETIARALWGKNWQPKPDAEGSKIFYWTWFALWTKDEINNMDADKKGTLLSANANNGADAGFGCLHANNRSSRSGANIGFRLCQETEEKAKYFGGRNFVKLWAEYLQFNFTTGDFITND